MRVKTVNISSVIKHNKLKSGYFLSDGVIYEELIKTKPYERLIDTVSYCSNIGGINKRIYVEKEYGIPMVSMSDMVNNDPSKTCKYVSKKIGVSTLKHLFKNQMILASVVGAIGELAIVNKNSEGFITGNNLIKFISERDNYNGFLYAFLLSRYGNELIKKLSGGAVQSYIDPELFKEIPIPIFDSPLREKINTLIQEASELRVSADNILKESVSQIESQMKYEASPRPSVGNVKISTINSNYNQRLTSTSYINRGQNFFKLLSENKKIKSDVASLSFSVHRPGIFKRIKVDSFNGLAYIKGSELSKQNPFYSCEYLSKTKTPFLNELSLKENQILFTCAGTVGDIKLITKEFEERKAIGSQDIIRIEKGDSQTSIYYLFCYLNTEIVQDYIQSLKYGAVIERVEPFHVNSIPVFIPENKVYEKIVSDIKLYKDNLYHAFKKEEKAIDLVEKEIESWQK
jgi:restriction endonuclease S subunit